jgi:hypothetical protein
MELGEVGTLRAGIGCARARALRRALGEYVTWIKILGITDLDSVVRAKTRKSGISEPWKSSYMKWRVQKPPFSTFSCFEG